MNNVLRIVLVLAGVLVLVVIAALVVGVVLLSKPGKPELVTLGTFPCGAGGELRLVEKRTMINRLEGMMRHELLAVRNTEEVRLEVEPMPAHLRTRTELQRHGDGPLFLQFFEPSPDVVACAEANADAIGALAKTSQVARRRDVEGKTLGRAYWSVPAESLDLEFREGDRRLFFRRDGTVEVTQGVQTTLVGIVREASFECCYGSVTTADLARFTSAEGKTAADVVAGLPVEPLRL